MKRSISLKMLGILIMSLMILSFYSCGKDNSNPVSNNQDNSEGPTGEQTWLAVRKKNGSPINNSNLEVSGLPNTIAFAISFAGNSWNYSINNGSGWLTEVEKTNISLKLDVVGNNGAERSATVKFYLKNDTSKSKVIKITQNKLVIPAADLFDVKFNDDATAKDVSQRHLTVKYKSVNHPVHIKYNNTFKRNVAYFNPPEPGSWLHYQGSWYRIDYINNSDFKEKIADGFSWECLVKFGNDYQTDPKSAAQGIFNMLEGGGAGFMVTDGSSGSNTIAFRVNVGGNTIKNNSNIVPDSSTWYHLVGVWDKEAGKTYLYVNGEKKAEVDDVGGDWDPPNPNANAQWICIGGKLAWKTINNAFKGQIAIARIYSNPLSAAQANVLWYQVKKKLNN